MIPFTSTLLAVVIVIVAAIVVMLSYSFHLAHEEVAETPSDREANLNRLRIYLRRRKNITIPDVVRLLTVSPDIARTHLDTLCDEGLLRVISPKSRTPHYERIQ